jgi:hypothetical protein
MKIMTAYGEWELNAKYYSPTEHLAVDEIVLFKVRVIFKQFSPKEHRWFGTKI